MATVISVPLDGDIPAIFPRRRRVVSDYHRGRRDRAVYIAGDRRDRRLDGHDGYLGDGPATYGLTEDERRTHARQLYRAGWSVEEITSVLDVSVAT